jgi:hypothetical protein
MNKAIITNESKEQESLDKLKDLIIGEYPQSFWKDPDIFKDLQALVDKSKGMAKLKEYWEQEHPDYNYFLEGLRDIVEKVMVDWSDSNE